MRAYNRCVEAGQFVGEIAWDDLQRAGLALWVFGQHSNPGIMPFGIIYCTVIPEFLRGLALKDRTALAADKRDMFV
jgi:hypothetical protein